MYLICFVLFPIATTVHVDESILYHGQLFYSRRNFNHWQMEFVLVKNIDAFVEVQYSIAIMFIECL